MQQAHLLLERMRLTKVPSEPYIEAATVETVYKVIPLFHVHSMVPANRDATVKVMCGNKALYHCHCHAQCSCQYAALHAIFICSRNYACMQLNWLRQDAVTLWLAKAYMHFGQQLWTVMVVVVQAAEQSST